MARRLVILLFAALSVASHAIPAEAGGTGKRKRVESPTSIDSSVTAGRRPGVDAARARILRPKNALALAATRSMPNRRVAVMQDVADGSSLDGMRFAADALSLRKKIIAALEADSRTAAASSGSTSSSSTSSTSSSSTKSKTSAGPSRSIDNFPEMKKLLFGLLDNYSKADADEIKRQLSAHTPKFEDIATAILAMNQRYTASALHPDGVLTRSKVSAAGAGRAIETYAEQDFATEQGRALQVARHVSSVLYSHAVDQFGQGKANADDNSPVEIQTMFHNGDIFISANNPETIGYLKQAMSDASVAGARPSLSHALSSLSAAEQSTSRAVTPHETRSILLRYRRKLEALAGGKRSGDPSQFNLAVEMIDAIGTADSPTDITVDHETNTVTGFAPKTPGSKARIFLVNNKKQLTSGGKEKLVYHAELGLIRVLDSIDPGQQHTSYLAGKRRACMNCNAALIEAMSRGHDLVFSPHGGKLWTNQINASPNDAARFTTLYLALAHPVFQTSSEEFDKLGRLTKVSGGNRGGDDDASLSDEDGDPAISGKDDKPDPKKARKGKK